MHRIRSDLRKNFGEAKRNVVHLITSNHSELAQVEEFANAPAIVYKGFLLIHGAVVRQKTVFDWFLRKNIVGF